MLSKFRKYENKLISFSKLIDIKYRGIWKTKGEVFYYIAKLGYKKGILYFISKFPWANKMSYYWNWAMLASAEKGNINLIEYFISKGANFWSWGVEGAIKGGHINMIDYFISKEDIALIDYYRYMCNSVRSDRKDLMRYFMSKLDKQGISEWGWCVYHAIQGQHIDLRRYFQQKINDENKKYF